MLNKVVNAIRKRVSGHAKDKAEERLLPQRPFERLAVRPDSALTIICDDGEVRDLEIVDVLDQAGVKGVFAISPDLVGRPGFLSYDQLRQIKAAGHEIAFHGATHDPFTGFPGEAALVAACQQGLDRMEAEGLGRPTTLVYPFGANNRAVRQAVAPLFECAFTTWYGLNPKQTNRYAIRRVPFGAYVGALPGTEAWYEGLIRTTSGGHHWLALMLHPSGQEHREEHNAMLSRLIRFAAEQGVPVRTAQAHVRA